MAIELPGEVAQLLQFVGVPWINANEDRVREFSSHVRKFASAISNTHQDASATLKSLGSGYSGAAYEALMNRWGSKTTAHIGEVTEACGILASALAAGADFIETTKIACIADLAVMAAEFVADQAASVATLGLAEAALPVIEEATVKLIEFAVQQIVQFILGEILNMALQPLMGKVEAMVEGLVLGTGGSAGTGSAGTGFEVDHAHLAAHAAIMGTHAQTVQGHAAVFASNVGALSFGS